MCIWNIAIEMDVMANLCMEWCIGDITDVVFVCIFMHNLLIEEEQ